MSAAYSLTSVPFFSGIPAKDLVSIANRLSWVRVSAGKVLLSQNERSSDVYIVVSGGLKVEMFAPNGKLMMLREAFAGELVGELSAIDGADRSATVSSVVDGLCAIASAAVFKEVLDAHPALKDRLLRELVQSVRSATNRIYELAILPVKERVICELWRLGLNGRSADGAILIDPAPTHETIAHQTGTHRETVTRVFGELARARIIAVSRRKFTILQPNKLADLVDEAVGYDVNRDSINLK